MSLRLQRNRRAPLYCSFCGKKDDEVGYLISGPTVFICNECVEMCREIGTTMLVENGVKALVNELAAPTPTQDPEQRHE